MKFTSRFNSLSIGLSLTLGLLWAHPSVAEGLASRCWRRAQEIAVTTINQVLPAKNWSGHRFAISQSGKANESHITLGDRISGGSSGEVYNVRVLPKELIPEGLNVENLVVKVPKMRNDFRGNPSSQALSQGSLRKEANFYQRLFEYLETMEGLPRYPKLNYWNKGSLPVAPIFRVIETKAGPFLLKLKITEDLAFDKNSQKAHQNYSKVSDLINLVFTQFGVNIDYLPHNLAWVSHPLQMQWIGLKEPGYVFYEFTMAPLNQPIKNLTDPNRIDSPTLFDYY